MANLFERTGRAIRGTVEKAVPSVERVIDRARVGGHKAMSRLPGKAGQLAQRANEVLGRPFADDAELADRRSFDHRGDGPAPTPAPAASSDREAAPVIVYHMDKTRRDAERLVEILDGAGIPHQVSNIEEDPAAQVAVKRDSKGYRLPVVFVAGEAIGGRPELLNLQSTGELAKKVFG